MTVKPTTGAMATAAVLQQAVSDGSPVMIPGAFQRRGGRVPVEPAGSSPAPLISAVAEMQYDRGRCEHQREGGGAPSERRGAGILARLWQCVLHPAELAGRWRQPLG